MATDAVNFPAVSSSSSSQPATRMKAAVHSEDRLSDLPDELIAEILSHMPTKEAIGTYCLSRRWRNLWKLIEGLDITLIQGTPTENSAISIKKLLSKIQSPNFFKLKLHVKGLYINAHTNFFFRGQNLTCQIYNSSFEFPMQHLVRLQLHEVSGQVMPSSSYSLPLLQTLVLDSVGVSGTAVEHLISKCPSLKSLFLKSLIGVYSVKISHQKLRYLAVLNRYLVRELFAPALRYLEFNGTCVAPSHQANEDHVFIDVPSLAMCVIHTRPGYPVCYDFPYQNLWKIMLGNLHHAKNIHLDHHCILQLSEGPMPAEKMLKCNSIFIKIKVKEPFKPIEALPKILPVFSEIEKLTLVLEERKFNRQGYARLWKPLVKVLSEFQQLKEIRVYGFICNENADNHPKAAWTLFSLITDKVQIPNKLKLDTSNDEHKFQKIMEDYIHKDNRKFLRATTFESVDLPSYTYTDTCLCLYMN